MFRSYFLGSMMLCALVLSPISASALEKVKVAQFGKEKFLLYLPLYIAMEEGYFAEHGLEIDLIYAGNDDQVFAAVAGGSADFGVGDPVFTAIAQEKGFPAKTIAMMITNLGVSGYTNNPEVPVVQKPEDLQGLRIGSFPKPSTTYTLIDALIRKNDVKEASIVEAAFGAQVALIESGRADIAVDIEPTISKMEHAGYRVVFDVSAYTEPQAITGLMTREDVIEKNPETAQAMVSALQQALDTLNDQPSIAIDVAKDLFPDMEERIIENAVARMNRLNVYPKSVIVKDDYWQRTLKTRLESGELKTLQPTQQSVDNSFAIKAQGGR